nr:mediator of RNA polymerase II transcription subunit 4 [Tanacetum cinerariifolium]
MNDILLYAHRISYITFTPPEFGAGTTPLRGALPPAPQEEQICASQLYTFADLDVGLPPENKDKFTIESLAENPSDANLIANMRIMDMLPPNIMVPSGWKPRMHVQLPTDLSILPPAGWKHGDPVALPPLDALDVPHRIKEKQPQPAHVLGLIRECHRVLKCSYAFSYLLHEKEDTKTNLFNYLLAEFVVQILISHEDVIKSIQFAYAEKQNVRHYEIYGNHSGVNFDIGTFNYPSGFLFLVSVSGEYNYEGLVSISFGSNKRKYGPFGCPCSDDKTYAVD